MSPFHKVARVALLLINLGVALSITSIPQPAQRMTGDLWINGSVTLNNVPATSGITVFNNSQIKTTQNSSATVNLGKLGRIKLEPETELRLQFSNDLIGGNLSLGLLAVSTNKGIKTKIGTPHVLVEANGTEVGLVSIEVKPEYTCVIANRGAATLTANQKNFRLNQGEALSFDANGLEKAGHCEVLKAASKAKPLLIAGAVTAAALIPLTRSSIDATRGVSTPPIAANEVSNQSAAAPTPNATGRPTTPIKPCQGCPVVCGCVFDKEGNPLPGQTNVTIFHVRGNNTCDRITVDCRALLGHFNLNRTPRNGHNCDYCPGEPPRPAPCPNC